MKFIYQVKQTLNSALGVLKAYRFLWTWFLVSRRLPVMLIFFFLIVFFYLPQWIELISIWLFPEIIEERLLGFYNDYQQHPGKIIFTNFLWFIYIALALILVVVELKRTLNNAKTKSMNMAQSILQKIEKLKITEPELLLDLKNKALSYIYLAELRQSVLAKNIQQVPIEATQVMNESDHQNGSYGFIQPVTSNRYQVIKELGKGAMGIVYLAEDTLLHRHVALKALSLHFASQSQFSARFYKEARMVAKLNHQGIVQIYDFIEQQKQFLIAMEYVEGQTLDDMIKERTLEKKNVYDFARQVSEAMAYAHQKNVIHRDLKPANVLITKNNKIKLTDFGLAKMNGSNETQIGVIMGSPSYMSPEQAKGDNVNHLSDIYSFGILLYQMLTGSKPFNGDTATSVIAQHLTQSVSFDSDGCKYLNDKDKKIITLLLQKEPSSRPQSFKAVLALLKNNDNEDKL